jgi:hypothetical protein
MADQAENRPDAVAGGERGDNLLTMNEAESVTPSRPEPSPLKAAVRQARIEAAERTGVVVDINGAEIARLEVLNDALAPIFADVPHGIDLFDRGVIPGDPPRLWIDAVAHVAMGRDRRIYRFLQDTRYGRRVLAESQQVETIVESITRYVARRLVERERALAGDSGMTTGDARSFAESRRGRGWRGLALFLLGLLLGAAGLLAAAWFLEPLIY